MARGGPLRSACRREACRLPPRKASRTPRDDGGLKRAASPRVRDQATGGLAKHLGVATCAKMEEDAHGGDREKQAAQRADGVPDPCETAARSYEVPEDR